MTTAFRSLLNQTCTIQQPTTTTDEFNRNKITGWTNLTTTEPCRLQGGDAREGEGATEKTAAKYKLYLQATASITEEYRVIVSSVTYEVLGVRKDQGGMPGHHIVCDLLEVRTN